MSAGPDSRTDRPAGSRPRTAPFLEPRVKVWLETEGRYAFGFGMSEILLAVDRAGSIKQAAADLGKSYRYVWGRVKEAEAALGCRLVETRIGGRDAQRSALTPTARQLVTDFLAVRGQMIRLVRRECARRFRWINARPRRP